MRLAFLLTIFGLLAFSFFSPLSNGQAAQRDQSAAGVALPKGYRAASFTCW